MSNHRTGLALITGDWLEQEDGTFKTYRGIVIDGWSGGVEWVADRAIADAVVADHAQMLTHEVDPLAMDTLTWEGPDLVWHCSEDPDFDRVVLERHGRPGDEQYQMPLWAWTVEEWLDADEDDD